MKNVFIKTYGCGSNKADSDIMRYILIKKKYNIVDSEDKADIVIVNTCYVKLVTQHSVRSYLNGLKNKLVIVAGCMSDIVPEELKELNKDFILIGTKHVDKIVEVIEHKRDSYGKRNLNKAKLDKWSKDDVYTIEICEGCNHNCAYCVVKQARGDVNSFPIENIVNEVESAVKKGFFKINLTAQDTACYGMEKGKSKLGILLKEILKLDYEFFIRVGMMNLSNLMPVIDEVLKCYKDKRIMNFIHIPVQSGSNRVLKLMDRGYTVNDFKMVVAKFRTIPKMNIATDIIVGFPGESEGDFEETVKLLKEIKPEVVNISRYGKRPGTKASKMKQIDVKIVKERSVKISKLI